MPTGDLLHDIRHGGGNWQGFLTAANGPIGAVSCAAFTSELHVCAIGPNRELLHDIRHGNGKWQGFLTAANRPISAVSCAGFSSELHVCAIEA